MWRALRSSRVILLRTLGSRKSGFFLAIIAPGVVRTALRGHLRQSRLLLEFRLLGGNDLEELVDDLVRGDALRLGGEVRDDAVAQDRVRHGPDVLDRHVEPAAQDRMGLGADDEVLAGARA